MCVVVRVKKDEGLEQKIRNEFPNISFTFLRKNEELDQHIENAEVLVAYGSVITEELIRKAKKLKWIMAMSAGIEKLPFQILKERKILVTNVRGIHKIQMAEYVFGYILQYAKRFDLLLKSQMRKEWNRIVKPKEIYQSTLAVVGAGAIGSQISQYGKAFGMKTIGVNRSGRKVPEFDETYSVECLEEVLKKADYVVSVLPSTPDTNEMFTAAQFRTMKKEAVFINVGRGNAVNEQDLLDALNHGEIAHAFLDVFQQEPLPENHPFWECENLTITPHLSGQSERYLERAYEIFFHNLRIYLNNGHDYINKIDLDRGY